MLGAICEKPCLLWKTTDFFRSRQKQGKKVSKEQQGNDPAREIFPGEEKGIMMSKKNPP